MAKPSDSKCKALVMVNHDPKFIHTVSSMLHGWGFGVLQLEFVKSTEEALRKFREHPDINLVVTERSLIQMILTELRSQINNLPIFVPVMSCDDKEGVFFKVELVERDDLLKIVQQFAGTSKTGKSVSVGSSSSNKLSVQQNKNKKDSKEKTWTDERKKKFIEAINRLGPENAVPKKILDRMNVEGLTRNQVASHLQRHRKKAEKLGSSRASGYEGDISSGRNTPGLNGAYGHLAPGESSSSAGFGENAYWDDKDIDEFAQAIGLPTNLGEMEKAEGEEFLRSVLLDNPEEEKVNSGRRI